MHTPAGLHEGTHHHFLAVRSGHNESRFTTCKRARALRGKTFDFVPNSATLDFAVATNQVLKAEIRKKIWDFNIWHGKCLGNLLLDFQTLGKFLLNLQDTASLALSCPVAHCLTDLVETGTQIKAEIFQELYFTDCTERMPPWRGYIGPDLVVILRLNGKLQHYLWSISIVSSHWNFSLSLYGLLLSGLQAKIL